jgi:hypothetical protein
MKYEKAVRRFRHAILPLVKAAFERNFVTDIKARRRAWNNWTEALLLDGTISANQYNTWLNPF